MDSSVNLLMDASLSMSVRPPMDDRVIDACVCALAQNGLALSDGDVRALLHERDEHLIRVERIERGAGILPELVLEFAGSSCLCQNLLVDQLSCLQEAFYSVRDDAPSYVSDSEILIALRRAFDGFAGGDAALLCETDSRIVLDLLDSEPADGIYGGYSHGNGLLGVDAEWSDRANGRACGWSDESDGVYRIADGSGRVYTFDPDEWCDDVVLPEWGRMVRDDNPIASFEEAFIEARIPLL